MEYAEKKTILDGIIRKSRPDLREPPTPQEDAPAGGQQQLMSEKNQPRFTVDPLEPPTLREITAEK